MDRLNVRLNPNKESRYKWQIELPSGEWHSTVTIDDCRAIAETYGKQILL